MNAIRKVHIKGFRRLRNVELEMRPLMVMIGANSVGKTSLLDAFSLLAQSAAGNFAKSLSNLGGISDIITYDRAENLSFHLDMEVAGYKPLEYELRITPQGASYTIESEILSQQRASNYQEEPFKHIESRYTDIRYYDLDERRLLRPTWEHNPKETSLSQVPKMFQQPEDLRRLLNSSEHYHTLDVGPRAPARLPQKMEPADSPGQDGEHLITFLYYLREGDRDRFETIEDALKAAFPGFERLSFPPAAAGVISMTWKERYFSRPLYVHQFSEGMLRFLWLAALLQSPSPPTVIMLDEPEVSLHPELLSLLVDLLREASQRSQIIVATHSDRLVRFLEPKEVLVMDIHETGCANTAWGDSFELEPWLQEYSLDQAWSMGRIGGRP